MLTMAFPLPVSRMTPIAFLVSNPIFPTRRRDLESVEDACQQVELISPNGRTHRDLLSLY